MQSAVRAVLVGTLKMAGVGPHGYVHPALL